MTSRENSKSRSNDQGSRSFVESLESIENMAREQEALSFGEVVAILHRRGYPALVIICSLPFCFPFNIPGLSTILGLLLAFIGFRITFGKRQWWPKWILEKQISNHRIEKLAQKTKTVILAMKKVVHPRLDLFIRHPVFRRLNGAMITFFALILSLPLPIPLTNILCALPIFCIGIGMLEDDGLAILAAYFLAFLCLTFFTFIYVFGKTLLLSF